MSDKKILQYRCNACSSVFPRWLGRCGDCGAWNSLEEELESKVSVKRAASAISRQPVPLHEVSVGQEERVSSGISELDHVLGEGFVRGAVTLLGGEPGIGKSTLALQVAQNVARQGKRVLYVTGEESVGQLFLRSHRTGDNPPTLFVLSETNMGAILHSVASLQPEFLILDSIQVVYHPEVPSTAGTVNQVRYCSAELIALIKEKNLFGLLIGHITKDGGLAGPKVLEHMVDVILYFEGERAHQYRLLRSFKNRYSSTYEIGIFEMAKDGLAGVAHNRSLFVDDVTLKHPGSVISSVCEGSRVMMVELQALVVDSGFGMAKRTFLGVDSNRAHLMVAALEKILGIRLSSMDVILNIIGGIKISEPALDLAIVMAIVSSIQEKSVGRKIGIIGEVGLTGELRPVPQADKRLMEFEKMGFEACILPKRNEIKEGYKGSLECLYVDHIREAIEVVFGVIDPRSNVKASYSKGAYGRTVR